MQNAPLCTDQEIKLLFNESSWIVGISKKYEKYERSNLNTKTPSIRILRFGYLDIDALQLSNVWIHGQLDISIRSVSGYMDTWILEYHGYLDTWIHGYFNFFSIRLMDSKNSLDIQVSGYPSILISKYPDTTSLNVPVLCMVKNITKKVIYNHKKYVPTDQTGKFDR